MKEGQLLEFLKNTPYFTKQNLSLVLQKEGENLNYWLKKLRREKLLVSLKKGLYISSYYQNLVKQNPKESESYLEYLANLLRTPSYISMEYVLGKNNLIPEGSFAITSITTKSPRTFVSEIGTFIFRNLKEELFGGFQTKYFKEKKINIATVSKALFDFLYLKRFSTKKELWNYLFNEGRINWDLFSKEDKKEFIYYVNQSGSQKMASIFNFLREEKVI